MRDILAEERFYSKRFYFSYSGLSRLLYSPKLFYKNYILNEREEKTDSHLVEGKLLHCLLFEEENFKEKFLLSLGSIPGGQTKTIVDRVFRLAKENQRLDEPLSNFKDNILSIMQEVGFYQHLKTDKQRLEKILVEDVFTYYSFLLSNTGGKDIIDSETYQKVSSLLQVIRDDENAMSVLGDSEKENIKNELMLDVSLPSYSFGLKGMIDRLIISNKSAKIVDLKTTGKTISEFKDTVEYYNYWMQAAIYVELVKRTYNIENVDFCFVVIDKYEQVYAFNVSPATLSEWQHRLEKVLVAAEYHYTNREYALPYSFLQEKITL